MIMSLSVADCEDCRCIMSAFQTLIDTGLVTEHSIAVDKLSASWQLSTGSFQMSY